MLVHIAPLVDHTSAGGSSSSPSAERSPEIPPPSSIVIGIRRDFASAPPHDWSSCTCPKEGRAHPRLHLIWRSCPLNPVCASLVLILERIGWTICVSYHWLILASFLEASLLSFLTQSDALPDCSPSFSLDSIQVLLNHLRCYKSFHPRETVVLCSQKWSSESAHSSPSDVAPSPLSAYSINLIAHQAISDFLQAI